MTCTGAATNATASEIWDRINPLLPVNATIDMMQFSYSFDPKLGFLGGPYTPMVTVELNLNDFQFASPLAALANAAGATNSALPSSRRLFQLQRIAARRRSCTRRVRIMKHPDISPQPRSIMIVSQRDSFAQAIGDALPASENTTIIRQNETFRAMNGRAVSLAFDHDVVIFDADPDDQGEIRAVRDLLAQRTG